MRCQGLATFLRISTSGKPIAQIFGEPNETAGSEAAEPEPTIASSVQQPDPSMKIVSVTDAEPAETDAEAGAETSGPEAAASLEAEAEDLCIAIVMLRRTIVFRPPRKMKPRLAAPTAELSLSRK